MTDIQTPLQRHNTMSAIRGKNTKPEMIVRRGLWKRGFRYRLNYKRLPGHPDLVLRKYKTCIFINGCFWHGHEGCKYYTVPKTNTEFWVNKVQRNKERDERVKHELNAMGWNCITVWECELKSAKREATLQSLAFTLNEIFLNNHKVKAYDEQVVETSLAAEEMSRQHSLHK
ncbi:MAG: DNA mismatch endonuclease Vsr [Bacteroidaceae bacterium]|nr:DNA mismatch endonuclease Vsr [Bacteroidaceae bacterium]